MILAGAAALHADELECRKCQHYDAGVREMMGCEGDTSEPIATMQGCYQCAGGDPSCEVCHGTDRWPLHRCPGADLDDGAATAVVLASYALDLHAWPVDGGIRSQTPQFLEVVGIVAEQRALKLERDRERHEKHMRGGGRRG